MAALAASQGAEVSGKWHEFALRERDLAELNCRRITLLALKTRGAQSFIDACERPFLQRGASFWCSQVTAWARDVAQTHLPGEPALLLDNEAVCWLAVQHAALPDVLHCLQARFLDDNEPVQLSRQWLQLHGPRLLPYYEAARSAGLQTATCLPTIGVERWAPSLLDLCRRPQPDGTRKDSAVLVAATRPEAQSITSACCGRPEDPALSDAHGVPGWYNPGKGEAYGFPSIAFSLADLAFAKEARRAIARQLRSRHGLLVEAMDTQYELVQRLGLHPARLCHLKIDGDSIGKSFVEQPLLLWPSRSLQLEQLMRDCYIEAIASIIRAERLLVLPADLLYFGGDDLVLTMPERLVDGFVEAFDSGLARAPTNVTPRFTWAGLCYELTPVDHRNRQAALGREAVAIRKLNLLLKLAKAGRDSANPEGTASTDFDQLRWRQLERMQGFFATLSG